MEEKNANELWKENLHEQSQPQPVPEPAADQLPQADDQSEQIDPQIAEIEDATGVHLYDGDPELAGIVRNQGVRAFYQSVEKAVIAKMRRTNTLPLDISAREAWQRELHKKER